MKVLITGATGFIGHALGEALSKRGHKISALVRDEARATKSLTFPSELHRWSSPSSPVSASALVDVEAVVHLAGEPIAEGRWTKEKKQRIESSRTEGTRNLVDAIRAHAPKCETLISSSAIGIYGFHQDEWLKESSPAGDDFLANVTSRWEQEALRAKQTGVRVVCVRTGMVLGRGGGALSRMLPVFKARIGGRLGSGEQWMSWIHLDDLVELYIFALENKKVAGAVNAVAPSPVRNKDFTLKLAHALGVNVFLPVPSFALYAAFGELAEILLKGQRVSADYLQELGFKFKYSELEPALNQIVTN